MSCWPRNCFGQLEEFDVFGLTEVLGTEKLLQADNLCAVLCGFADKRNGFLEVGFQLLIAAHLDQTNLNTIRLQLFRHEGSIASKVQRPKSNVRQSRCIEFC